MQEKILPFVPVSQAVTVPEEEPSPLDEVDEELRRLHLERRNTEDSAERPRGEASDAGGGKATDSTADGAQSVGVAGLS